MSGELVVKTWLWGDGRAETPAVCRSPRNGGWPDVATMQRDRLAHYEDHPRERAEPIPNGFRVYWRHTEHLHQEVTLEGQ